MAKKKRKYNEYLLALRYRIDKFGIHKVQSALGYRSPSTIYTWLQNGSIPATAIDKVREYCHGGKPLTLGGK